MYEPFSNSVSSAASSDNDEENELAEENKSDDEDDVPLAVLKLSLDLFGCTFDDLIQVDESVRTCDMDLVDWDNTPVADLIHQVSNDPVGGSDSETEDQSSTYTQEHCVVTLNEAYEYDCVQVEKICSQSWKLCNTKSCVRT